MDKAILPGMPMKQENDPIVFRTLLERCAADLLVISTALRQDIARDEGLGLRQSAASLAQGALIGLKHVVQIRQIKECFRRSPLSAQEEKMCDDYKRAEKRFHEDVVGRLLKIAEEQANPPAPIFKLRPKIRKCWDWLRQKLTDFATGRDAEPWSVQSNVEMTNGQLPNYAPQLLEALNEIIKSLDDLSRRMATTP